MSLSSKHNNISNKGSGNVDDEWSSFISNKYDNINDDPTDNDDNQNNNDLNGNNNGNCNGSSNNKGNGSSNNNGNGSTSNNNGSTSNNIEKLYNNNDAPIPSDIYISTKSKIAYLTAPVDLKIFWDIPVIPYATPSNGVIKKQIKINSKSQDELDDIQQRLQKELYFDEHIMSHIDNPSGRIKFKDIRKITIGISKKDIMSYRSKKKQAFYNCFVLIIRLKIGAAFREFHIKVFNTGKLEIPGVQSDEMFELVLKSIIDILQIHSEAQLSYNKTSDTVLINSNFHCGFFIDRETLYDILKYKYNIHAIYDPCSYPGVQCKFYYNKDIGIQTGKQINTENKEKYKNIVEVSFMIFRTGSVLIVGMCEEDVLIKIYEFLKQLLHDEFENICQGLVDSNNNHIKDKNKKIRKKIITVLDGNNNINNINISSVSNIGISGSTNIRNNIVS